MVKSERDAIIAYGERMQALASKSSSPLQGSNSKAEKLSSAMIDLEQKRLEAVRRRQEDEIAKIMTREQAMVDLQLKKLAIDKKHGQEGETFEGEGVIVTDRNSILEKLKNLNK